MEIASDKSSSWMIDFQKSLIRGKHVLLYGNIADQFLLNGQYCSLPGFLNAYFQHEGYDLVGSYDVVDGFRFCSAAMQEEFLQLVQSRVGGTASAPTRGMNSSSGPSNQAGSTPSITSDISAAGISPDPFAPAGRSTPRDGDVPPRRPLIAGADIAPPTARGASFPAGATTTGSPRSAPITDASRQPAPSASADRLAAGLRDPQQAMSAIRLLIGQNQRSAAVTLAFSDKLVSSADHQDFQERCLLIHLMKSLQEAAYIPAGRLAGRRNVVVILAGQLGAVPTWLHKDNPFLEPLQVSRPRLEERKMFLRFFGSRFYEGASLTGRDLEQVAGDFANLTEGFTAWDLEAVRRTSMADRIPIARTKTLIDYYKYGLRDDPWERIDAAHVAQACQLLEQRVIGQPHALRAAEGMLMSARVGVSMAGASAKGGRPKGTFFFVGPTGVGKTELAKAMTEFIFSDETAFARFDMSEYAEKQAAEKLTGAPPGYVGYEEGGLLTNRMRTRPFSLLLFDEMEKADASVMDKFLQILEDGRLTDGKGQTAYFSQAVIIFTSNIGSDTLKERIDKEGNLPTYEEVREHYRRAVADRFSRVMGRPELLNRLGENILVFDLLRPEYIPGILNKFLRMLGESVRERLGAEFVFPDGSVEAMIREQMQTGDNLLYGGRRIKSLLEECVERPLNRWLFSHPKPPSRLELTVASNRNAICINGEPVS